MEIKIHDKEYKLPGMRVLKTVLAAFICMVIDYFRGEIPIQTVVTTTICIQPDPGNTIASAISRIVGTIIGALFGIATLFVVKTFEISMHPLLYYFIITLIMVPLIVIVTKLKCSKGVIVALVVFISITLTTNTATVSWTYTLNRVLDTLIGILVAVPVNLLLPNKAVAPEKQGFKKAAFKDGLDSMTEDELHEYENQKNEKK